MDIYYTFRDLMKAKVTVIIPAKNEEEGIGNVINELPKGVNVIVVDEASKDSTPKIAKSHGAQVIIETREGYGRAYKTGFENLPKNTEYVACLDADGTYPGKRIEEFVELLEKENLDFISCGRIFTGKNMRAHHRLGNRVLTGTANLLFWMNLRDSQSGMWVFRRDVLDKVMPESDGMPFSEELKILVRKKGLKFREVPITYGERIGKVKLKSFRDGIGNLLYLFRLRMGL